MRVESGSSDIASIWLRFVKCGEPGAVSSKSKKSGASKSMAQIGMATLMMSVISSVIRSLV